ncbi:MAG: TlpA family protein disulfide reductase [Lachnospiraceae bacterium]|nr:TlpA family protein disulfide reductase [Lachnospiraceae bacterium]
MKVRKNKYYALFLAGLCCLTILGGCASDKEESSEKKEELQSEEEQSADTAAEDKSVGEFSMQDVNGETYTEDMFADYDLTMVNVFATWCTPCINEIPDLQKLWEEMEDQGICVTGIVLDSIDSLGNVDEDAVEKAKVLAEQTGVTYPFLIPDESNMNGRLTGITAIPETFFVDKEGNIVGETYSGSRSLEQWRSVVETELKGMKQ